MQIVLKFWVMTHFLNILFLGITKKKLQGPVHGSIFVQTSEDIAKYPIKECTRFSIDCNKRTFSSIFYRCAIKNSFLYPGKQKCHRRAIAYGVSTPLEQSKYNLQYILYVRDFVKLQIVGAELKRGTWTCLAHFYPQTQSIFVIGSGKKKLRRCNMIIV